MTANTHKTLQDLGLDDPHPRRFWRWPVLALVVLLGVVVWFGGGEDGAGEGPQYETQAVEEGPLRVTVSATGTLEPTDQVDVGAEISGRVMEVLVDNNDAVRAGQVLARMDTRLLQAQVLRSRASLKVAQARVLQARTTLKEKQVDLRRLKTIGKLGGARVVAEADVDAAAAAAERAEADVASAEASVAEAEAALNINETDLAKTEILSPIDGVVLTRRIEPGQTVAATLNTPVLFTLAKDLGDMVLKVSVDEADIGQVKVGQQASFMVDAYPDKTFNARITQVRLGATTTNNVVSYDTELAFNNADFSLRPGMTAAADIVVQELDKVVLVPNAALRFVPPVTSATPEEGEQKRSMFSRLFWRPIKTAPSAQMDDKHRNGRQLWVLETGQLRPVTVTLGASDGSKTQILSGDLPVGARVVIAQKGPVR